MKFVLYQVRSLGIRGIAGFSAQIAKSAKIPINFEYQATKVHVTIPVFRETAVRAEV
jgi:hypothetical protein